MLWAHIKPHAEARLAVRPAEIFFTGHSLGAAVAVIMHQLAEEDSRHTEQTAISCRHVSDPSGWFLRKRLRKDKVPSVRSRNVKELMEVRYEAKELLEVRSTLLSVKANVEDVHPAMKGVATVHTNVSFGTVPKRNRRATGARTSMVPRMPQLSETGYRAALDDQEKIKRDCINLLNKISVERFETLVAKFSQTQFSAADGDFKTISRIVFDKFNDCH